MSWEDFVAENEGPELDEARARLRGDEPPAVREPRRPSPIQPQGWLGVRGACVTCHCEAAGTSKETLDA